MFHIERNIAQARGWKGERVQAKRIHRKLHPAKFRNIERIKFINMNAIYKPSSNYSMRAIFGCRSSSNMTHIMARARSHFNLWNYWNGMPLLKFIKCGMRCHRYHCCRLLYQNEIFKWIKQQKIVAAVAAAAVKFTPSPWFWFFNKI